MTLPTLIQNYQKGVAISKLKQTYSQLSNGMELAAAEFDTLPINKWSCDAGAPEFTYNQENCFHIAVEKVAAKMYPRPDTADHIFCYEGKDYNSYKTPNGNTFSYGTSTYNWSAQMPNGACVVWYAYAWNGNAGGRVYIDIDGPYKGYNTWGKDTFAFEYTSGNIGTGMGPNGRSLLPWSAAKPMSHITGTTEGCSKNASGLNCAAYIMLKGWTMPDNYPW